MRNGIDSPKLGHAQANGNPPTHETQPTPQPESPTEHIVSVWVYLNL